MPTQNGFPSIWECIIFGLSFCRFPNTYDVCHNEKCKPPIEDATTRPVPRKGGNFPISKIANSAEIENDCNDSPENDEISNHCFFSFFLFLWYWREFRTGAITSHRYRKPILDRYLYALTDLMDVHHKSFGFFVKLT